MAKITNKNIKDVLEDFKQSLFISVSLEKQKVNHCDFFNFIEDPKNKELFKEYRKILSFNNKIKEDAVAQQAYGPKGDKKLLARIMAADNPDKYSDKQSVEIIHNSTLSDEELKNRIVEKMKSLGLT